MNIFQILMASNSDAEKNMAAAREYLKRVFPERIRFSAVVESKAVNSQGMEVLGAESYLNALCLAQSERPLDSVQSMLKTMETEIGRVRGLEAKGQVAIDLDLVVWNDNVLRPWDVNQAFYRDCLNNLKIR